MKFKKNSFLSLLVLVILSIIGFSSCANQGSTSEDTSTYKFKVSDKNKIEEQLVKQKYNYSENVNRRIIAVVLYDDNEGIVSEYVVDNGKNLDISIPISKEIAISLPANRTILYTWNMKNTVNENIVNFNNRSWISIPIVPVPKDATGVNYDRQNFYFHPLKVGKVPIVMSYDHQEKPADDFFEFTINLNITE